MSGLHFLFCVFYCGGGVCLFVCFVVLLFFSSVWFGVLVVFLVACLFAFGGKGVVDCFCLARIL